MSITVAPVHRSEDWKRAWPAAALSTRGLGVVLALALFGVAAWRVSIWMRPPPLSDVPPAEYRWDAAAGRLMVGSSGEMRDAAHPQATLFARKALKIRPGMDLADLQKAGVMLILCRSEGSADGKVPERMWRLEDPARQFAPDAPEVQKWLDDVGNDAVILVPRQ